MKNLVLLLIVIIAFQGIALPQSCLPEGINFYTQEEIDSFQVNYPDCSQIDGDVTISGDEINNLEGLNSISSVQGNVTIYSNPLLSSLDGLNGLNSIGGNLSLGIYESGFYLGNPALADLSGLDNLTLIGGDLTIEGNTSLTSIAELGSVTSIGDLIKICSNPVLGSLTGLNNIDTAYGVVIISGNSLTDLSGLNGLKSAGQLDITGNSSLISLAGLNDLKSIDWNLFIEFNPELSNLNDLESLNRIGHNIYIDGNSSLTNLYGLDNVQDTSIDYLLVIYNQLLSTCDVQFLCEQLASPNGTIELHDNAQGCNSQEEVEAACLSNCLPDGISLTSQEQIDSFQVNYPGCTEIKGDVKIESPYINNLNGLSVITKIGGDLDISYDYIHNLNGLENLTHIGGDLILYQNSLLTHISGLNKLTLINGILTISHNYSLTNLSGLENIAAGSITDLHIIDNFALSTCEVQSICDYLASPNGVIDIQINNIGCNNPQEVEDACLLNVKENTTQESYISIYPNPSTTSITIESPSITPVNNTNLAIFNISAQQVKYIHILEPKTVLDISTLPGGVYFVKVANDRTVMVSKFVKQ